MTTKQLPPGDWRIAVYGRGQIGGNGRKRAPRAVDRERVIATQGYKCLYCEIPIATRIWRKSREVTLRPAWDHFMPFAYSQRNPRNNWVLACHVCNGIKYSRIFADVEAARKAILPARIVKGYEEAGAVLHRLGLERDQQLVLLSAAKPSPRQLEALQWAAKGLSQTESAAAMRVSPSRVSGLLTLARRQLGAETCEEAIDIAHRNGFISRPEDTLTQKSEAS